MFYAFSRDAFDVFATVAFRYGVAHYLEVPRNALDFHLLNICHVSKQEHAEQGATAAPDANADVDLHFAAFVPVNGHLWELDGRKTGPVNHGTTSVESLLRDVAKVVRESFMERAGENFNFSLIALAAADGEGQD
jgi:predicted HD phosphohydrolase